jgi:hypothetical protein
MRPGAIRLLWLVYFVCLIPALVTLVHRAAFDRGFNSVALVADYVQLLELAQTENIPEENLLARLKDEAGIDRLALLEDTPVFLAQRGLCTIVEGVGWPGWKTPKEREEIERNRGREIEEARPPEADWPLLMGLRHDLTHLVLTDPDLFQRVARAAEARYPGLVEVIDEGGRGGVVSLAGEPKIVLEWGLGFDPVLVARLRRQGLTIYPRLRNYPGYSKAAVEAILNETSGMFPGGWVIFDGDSVLGSPGLVGSVAEALRAGGRTGGIAGVGWVEFAEQRGAESLARSLPHMTARVHSIEDEEMETVTPGRAIARFLRAVRERAVRIVYLKPFLLLVDPADRVEKSLGMFADARKTLETRGFTVGEPSIISGPLEANAITRLAAALACGIALVLLLCTLNVRPSYVQSAVILVAILLASLLLGRWGTKLAALGLALLGPTLSVAWLARRYDTAWNEVQNLRIAPFWPALGLWLGAILITLTSGLLIAASLINHLTLLQIDSFSGVKLALYLPILLALVIGVWIVLPEDRRSIGQGLSWLLLTQVRIWHVLIVLVGLVGVFVMLDRSGNFPVIAVSNWENDIRGWFETLLYARPRTKEAFIGHPALVLGLYLGLSALNARRAFVYAGVVVGAIALTSLTNTFCHIHTPLALSLYRTAAGGVIGAVVGLALGILVLGSVGRLRRRRSGRKRGSGIPE